MLVAPIFHNNYLSPKGSESQAKQSDAVSSSSPSTKISESSASSKYNNIFKSAFNRSISFFSKITTSSGSPSTSTTSASTSSKPPRSESNHDSSSSSSSATPSDCSSPDSLKTEMIFFKPIIREPKTPSNAKPVLLRIPSIRSAASSTDLISSPCPSPFFIPITPRRQSAFSFVSYAEEDSKESEGQIIAKPKATKRKTARSSPQKPAAKRLKPSPKSNNSRQITTGKSKAEQVTKLKPDVVKPKQEVKTNRKTRSMDKKDSHEPSINKGPEKKPLNVKKSPIKKNLPTAATQRVTRSHSLKH